MARLARVVAAEVPHHVTRRENARRFLLSRDTDRKVYPDLLREDIETCKVSLIGYCLMSNHVHLIVVPTKAEKLTRALKRTHGWCASSLGYFSSVPLKPTSPFACGKARLASTAHQSGEVGLSEVIGSGKAKVRSVLLGSVHRSEISTSLSESARGV